MTGFCPAPGGWALQAPHAILSWCITSTGVGNMLWQKYTPHTVGGKGGKSQKRPFIGLLQSWLTWKVSSHSPDKVRRRLSYTNPILSDNLQRAECLVHALGAQSYLGEGCPSLSHSPLDSKPCDSTDYLSRIQCHHSSLHKEDIRICLLTKKKISCFICDLQMLLPYLVAL